VGEADSEKITTVLWLSRHKMLPAQIDYIARKLKNFRIVIYNKPIATAEDAVRLIRKHRAEYVIPVLPLSFIARLVEESKKHGFKVLRADMQLIHLCEKQPCPDYNPQTDTIVVSRDLTTGETIYRHFRFKGFKILKDIIFVEEDW